MGVLGCWPLDEQCGGTTGDSMQDLRGGGIIIPSTVYVIRLRLVIKIEHVQKSHLEHASLGSAPRVFIPELREWALKDLW